MIKDVETYIKKLKNEFSEYLDLWLEGNTTTTEELSFIDKCIIGDAFIDEIDDYLAKWHSGLIGRGLGIIECLGFTPSEYFKWIKNPDTLKDVIDNRINLEYTDGMFAYKNG